MACTHSLCVLVIFATACGATRREPTDPPVVVVGPFTGTTSRWVMDGVSTADTDLHPSTRDKWVGHSKIGGLLSAVFAVNDGSTATPAMRSSGVLRSTLELISDDPVLANDNSVGMRYVAGIEDSTSIELGGRLARAQFHSNGAFDRAAPLIRGELLLPVFRYADPIRLRVTNLETSLLVTDTSLEMLVQGGVLDADVKAAVFPSVNQMVAFRPTEFGLLRVFFDPNFDGVITREESDAAIDTLVNRDVRIDDSGRVALHTSDASDANGYSLGVVLRFVRCESGWCGDDSQPCTDRVQDGDETSIDCGGSCGPCSGTAPCKLEDRKSVV